MWEATAQVLLAGVLNEQGDVARAAACAEESLALFEENGNTWGVSRALYVLGGVAARRGDRAQARSLHEASLALDHELGDHQGRAQSLIALAGDVLSYGDARAARQLYAESLTLAEQAGDRLTLARGLEGLAGLIATEWPERAVRVAGAADALRESLGATAHPAERDHLRTWLSAARRALGEQAFAAAWAAGRLLSFDDAFADALDAAGPEHDPGPPDG